MNRQFLTDTDVEAAFDWLQDHANAVAQAPGAAAPVDPALRSACLRDG